MAMLNDPFAKLEGPLAGTTRMRLEVVENRPLTPSMQQLVLAAPELGGFGYLPGQDFMLMVAVDGDRPVRRRYTIRHVDPVRCLLTLGIVRHDGGPGERWVATARPGDEIEGIGPRGKIFPAAQARWHLFAGDFSALPAFFAMAGSLPAGQRATVILEVPGPGDEQELAAAADVAVAWLHSDGRPPGDPSALAGALAEVPLPPGPATRTWPARPPRYWRCARPWRRAGWPTARCRRRPTGGWAGPTHPTVSPPGTGSAGEPGQNGVAVSQASSRDPSPRSATSGSSGGSRRSITSRIAEAGPRRARSPLP